MRKLPDETIEREALLGVGVCVAGGASARRLLLLCCVIDNRPNVLWL